MKAMQFRRLKCHWTKLELANWRARHLPDRIGQRWGSPGRKLVRAVSDYRYLRENANFPGKIWNSQLCSLMSEELPPFKTTRSCDIAKVLSCQNEFEQLRATRESFGQHLEMLEAIDPKSWNPADLHKELSRALSTVDDARAEFSQQRSRLQAIATQDSEEMALPEATPEAGTANGQRPFLQWMLIGFAFSLPLIVFGLIGLALFFFMAKG